MTVVRRFSVGPPVSALGLQRSILAGPYDDIIEGTAGNDILRGSFGGEWIYGLGGRDRLYGGDGDDILDGGGGTDRIDGGSGSDTVLYTVNTTPISADLLSGRVSFPGQSWSAERLVSIENIHTGSGDDIVLGNAAANTIVTYGGNDRVRGGDGADVIDGGTGNDVLWGEGGDDTLLGGAGRDRLFGGAGDDMLDGGGGTDRIDGGAGSDTVLYAANTTPVNVNLAAGVASFPGQRWLPEVLISIENVVTGSGDDMISGSRAANAIATGAGADIVNAGGGNDTVSGGDGNDRLRGGSGDDHLTGGFQNDRLYGGAGDDTLEGGGGIDYIDGGEGNDTAIYAHTYREDDPTYDLRNDPLSVHADLGRGIVGFAHAEFDRAIPNYSETLVSIENITTGSGNDIIRGSDVANVIDAGRGANVVFGGAGDDVIHGSFDADRSANWYDPDTMGPADSFGDYLDGGDGNDILYSNGSYYLSAGAVRYTTDAGLEIVNGGNGDDTLVAGYGDLRLSGGSGADSFRFGEERYDIAPGASPYSLYAGQRATITDFSRAEGDRIVIDAVNPASAAFTDTPPNAVGEWGFYRDAGDLHARYIFAEEEYEWARDPQSYLLDIDIRFADYSGSLAQSDFAFV